MRGGVCVRDACRTSCAPVLTVELLDCVTAAKSGLPLLPRDDASMTKAGDDARRALLSGALPAEEPTAVAAEELPPDKEDTRFPAKRLS